MSRIMSPTWPALRTVAKAKFSLAQLAGLGRMLVTLENSWPKRVGYASLR